MLINLLGNAIKFTKEGEVVLHTHAVQRDLETVLIIEVIDSGIGIPVDKQNDLFKPFVQLVQSRSEIKGTGLGLAISKSLVELMDGNISARSILGKGSTFTIELPVILAKAEDVEVKQIGHQVKKLAPNQPEWKLLVVDDNSDNLLLLTTMLSSIGFSVREARNGQEAIAVFKEWQPHLIFMDMRMPVMDGYDATAIIRHSQGGDKVKIIALTASAFKEQHGHIIDAGCDAVLHKPFHVQEIFATLGEHLALEFVYQEEEANTSEPTEKVSIERFEKLPLDLRQQLQEYALQLDVEEMENVIKKIRDIDTKTANSLSQMVSNYQFEEIVVLTQEKR